jgi:hypothetical protein
VSSLHILDPRFSLELLVIWTVGLAIGDWRDLNPGPRGRKPHALPLDQAAPHAESHKRSIYEKKPQYIGTKMYQALPGSLRSMNGVNLFKNKLKKFLLNHPFYDVHEEEEKGNVLPIVDILTSSTQHSVMVIGRYRICMCMY